MRCSGATRAMRLGAGEPNRPILWAPMPRCALKGTGASTAPTLAGRGLERGLLWVSGAGRGARESPGSAGRALAR